MTTGQWQPIETAPANKRVLLYDEEDGIVTGMNEQWEYQGRKIDDWNAFDGHDLGDSDYCRMIKPTYWMPLPDKPRASET